jgi:hypothetical protein
LCKKSPFWQAPLPDVPYSLSEGSTKSNGYFSCWHSRFEVGKVSAPEALNSVRLFEKEGRVHRFGGDFRWFLFAATSAHMNIVDDI